MKTIVIDDDPTGSQTVHGCLLLTAWDVETLSMALADASPLFFILSNTRGMTPESAAVTTRAICRNLRAALNAEVAAGRPMQAVFVSRSDSTLRGHYPVETDIITEELGPFDAHFLVPAFLPGGRITRDGTHYLLEADGTPVPVHETEFARDSVFTYHHSHLPDYIEEKTRGRIPAAAVTVFTRRLVRERGMEALLALTGNACGCVDAEEQADLDAFAALLRPAMQQGRRYLFRSGASILNALVPLPPQPVAAEDMHRITRNAPGIVLVGSHVKKTTEQIQALLATPLTVSVEIDIARVDQDQSALRRETLDDIYRAAESGQTAVVFTSRTERRDFAKPSERLAFGERVSAFLMSIVHHLPPGTGFLISKGGITSNDVLSKGLELRASRVLGQILTGCSVVQCPDDHPRQPGMPVVIFPGNVGSTGDLAEVHRRLSAQS